MNFDRTTKYLLGFLSIGVWLLITILLFPNFFAPLTSEAVAHPVKYKPQYDSLTVHKLKVVNQKGEPQFVISDSSNFPPPIINGKVYKNARSISPGGALFYDQQGNEIGGLSFYNRHIKNVDARIGQMTLDSKNSDVIGIGVADARPKGFSAGLSISDPVPLGTDLMKHGSSGKKRIGINNINGDAKIVLRNAKGNKRLVLGVEKSGKTYIHFIKSGKVVKSISAN